MKNKILLMTLSDPSCDPRPNRFIKSILSKGYEVDLYSWKVLRKDLEICTCEIPDSVLKKTQIGIIFRRIIIVLQLLIFGILKNKTLAKRITQFQHRISKRKIDLFLQNDYSFILVEDLFFLPFLFESNKKHRIIFDAREFYPGQQENNWFFRLLEKPYRNYICKNYLNQCSLIITVSEGIAQAYNEAFQIEGIKIIRSIPDITLVEQENFSHKYIENSVIKLVHHGVANRNRKLENLIYIGERLGSNYTLDLFLNGDEKYISELTKIAQRTTNVKIKKPIKFTEIIQKLKEYDIGLFYVEPTTVNLKYCLPNKFFEFIHAGLAVAIGPSPDMRELLHRFQNGIISNKFELSQMTREIAQLKTADIIKLKHNSRQAALELSWQKEENYFHLLVNQILHAT